MDITRHGSKVGTRYLVTTGQFDFEATPRGGLPMRLTSCHLA